jgi:hypothetical protein
VNARVRHVAQECDGGVLVRELGEDLDKTDE